VTRAIFRCIVLAVTSVPTPALAFSLLQNQSFALVFVSLVLPEMSGIDFMKEVKKTNPELPFIVASVNESIDTSTRCYKFGAFDVLQAPINSEVRASRPSLCVSFW